MLKKQINSTFTDYSISTFQRLVYTLMLVYEYGHIWPQSISTRYTNLCTVVVHTVTSRHSPVFWGILQDNVNMLVRLLKFRSRTSRTMITNIQLHVLGQCEEARVAREDPSCKLHSGNWTVLRCRDSRQEKNSVFYLSTGLMDNNSTTFTLN